MTEHKAGNAHVRVVEVPGICSRRSGFSQGNLATTAGAEGDWCDTAKALQGAEVLILDRFGDLAYQYRQSIHVRQEAGPRHRVTTRHHGRSIFPSGQDFQQAFNLSAGETSYLLIKVSCSTVILICATVVVR